MSRGTRARRWIGAGSAVALAMGAGAVTSGCDGLRDPAPPAEGSIILISLDTLRGDMLGSDGFTKYPTSPFLDAFAEDAIYFERCIVPETWTLSSHMSLLTGLAPHHHGVQEDRPLSAEVPTLQRLLKENGFRTQAFVDGGYLNPKFGFDHGFDDYFGERIRGFEDLLERAVDWLDDHADERFFLFLHTYDVHSLGDLPLYDSLPEHAGRFSGDIDSRLNTRDADTFKARWAEYEESLTDTDVDYIRATYADGIRQADAQLEAFFDYLKARGIYDSALIVVWADHGEGLHDHEYWLHADVFETTIRVPLIIRPPGGVGGPKRVRSVVSSLDIMPTILELAGVTHDVPLDGESLLGLVEQEDPEAVAFTMDRWEPADRFSIRSLRHHLIWKKSTGTGMLFDLEADPGERENLYGQGLPVEAKLQARLFEYIAEYEATLQDGRAPERDTVTDEIREELRVLGYVE